ncbi:MAG: hypothetical protein WCP96_18730 [Methylococcaceae bacterium]
MGQVAALAKLPAPIQDELITRILSGFFPLDELVQWLLDTHGINAGRSATWRYSKATRDKFERLVKFGMPVTHLVKNRCLIEAQGIANIERELMKRLTEKSGCLYAYLDEKVTP